MLLLKVGRRRNYAEKHSKKQTLNELNELSVSDSKMNKAARLCGPSVTAQSLSGSWYTAGIFQGLTKTGVKIEGNMR